MAFRQHTQLPLDDCLYALQETLPHLSRSALHRLFQRHGISRLPAPEPAEQKTKFKDYSIGYLHVDFAEVHTEEGQASTYLSPLTAPVNWPLPICSHGPRSCWRQTSCAACWRLFRYKVHKVLTDNGTQFGNMPHQVYAWRHIFDRVCDEHGIEHRFTKPAHPWTNGQVERFNRTLKEATVRRYHYQTTAQLNEHLQAFLLAYNHAKRLKRLRGKTPHEFICQQWRLNPTTFIRDPTQLILGLYT